MQYTFVPVTETFLSETGSRLSSTTGDTRETSFLFQSLSTKIQSFNAVAFQGTLSRLSGQGETNKQRPLSQDRSKNISYMMMIMDDDDDDDDDNDNNYDYDVNSND